MSVCSIAGCNRKHYGRGWCGMHYQRWFTRGKSGDPTITTRSPRGSGSITKLGYRKIGDRHAHSKLEHVIIAERVLGKPLPPGAQVHHVDGNGCNNDPSNLVICPSDAYHKLLHRRARALAMCGHAEWIVCGYCRKYSPPSEMYIHGANKSEHRACRAAYAKKWREQHAK